MSEAPTGPEKGLLHVENRAVCKEDGFTTDDRNTLIVHVRIKGYN